LLKTLKGAWPLNLGQLTVQRSESSGIVKTTTERILLGRELAKHIQLQLAGPPIPAARATASSVAEGRTLSERVVKRDEGGLVPLRQEVSLVDAGIGTALGGDQRQEPDQ
jgi:hypothetical protein